MRCPASLVAETLTAGKMSLLSGPRQVGTTTLAKSLLGGTGTRATRAMCSGSMEADRAPQGASDDEARPGRPERARRGSAAAHQPAAPLSGSGGGSSALGSAARPPEPPERRGGLAGAALPEPGRALPSK